MGGREDLDGALKAIMAAKREELGGPPTPEELLAYRDGTLDPVAREELEAKLAVYPDAARTLADIASFPNVEPAPGTPVLSEEDVEARWQALKKLLTPIPSPIALPSTGRGAPPPAAEARPPSPGRAGVRWERGARGVRSLGPHSLPPREGRRHPAPTTFPPLPVGWECDGRGGPGG